MMSSFSANFMEHFQIRAVQQQQLQHMAVEQLID